MGNSVRLARGLVGKGRTEAAVDTLHAACEAGDGDAATELALWYLRGDIIPRDLSRAREVLGKAAQLGNEDAVLLEIAFTANGTGGVANWQASLSLLKQAAEHFPYLKRELEIIDSLQLDELGYPRRRPCGIALDRRVNLIHFPGFLTHPERQHIANIALGSIRPSTVFDPETGRQIRDPIRTSHGTVIGPAQEDLIFQAIYRRIAQATSTDMQQGEPLSVLRYDAGQQYKLHFDAISGSVNNRIKTVLMYLNDSFEGGETAFPDLEIAIQPKAGDAIVFDGVNSDGTVNTLSRHAGLPVTRGTKWVATRWIRALAFDPWRMPGVAR